MVSVAAIVKLSLVALGVKVILLPAVIVKVSTLESASILVCPTTILPNAFWFTSAHSAITFNFVFNSVVKSSVDNSLLVTTLTLPFNNVFIVE